MSASREEQQTPMSASREEQQTPMSAEPSDWLVSPALAPGSSDDPLAPLYEAAAEGRLRLPFCADCGLALELEQSVCDRCRSAQVRWDDVRPSGVVHAATLVHRVDEGLILVEHPYPVLDVEVSSGHRLIMTTLAESDRLPAIGAPVTIGFRAVAGTRVPAAVYPETAKTRTALAGSVERGVQ